MKEEYLYRVRRIRRYFTGGAYDEFYCKLLNDERAWKRAGLAVLVSVMNGTVGGTLIALLLFPCGIPAAVVGATVVFCVGVWGQLKWVEVDEEKAKASIKENGGREPLSPWDDAS